MFLTDVLEHISPNLQESIQADFVIYVFWMASILSLIFNSSNHFSTWFIIIIIIIIIVVVVVPDIGLAVRVFANGSGDLGSIPGRVIPKTQKMALDASLLNTQHYKVRIKGKVEQSREGVVPSPTPWCSSYRKGSLRVTLDYGRQLYLLLLLLIVIII